MKIETLVNLTGGELINRPFISEVVFFTNNAEAVNRGSCFFATDISSINEAIKNGAYAIIIDKELPVLDKEIAWIRVDDFKKAIFNIFKYENLKNKIYLTDKITSSIIKAMSNEKNVVVIKDEFKDLLKALNLNNKFIVTSKKEFKEIFANVEEIKSENDILIMKTLFKSEFKGIEINLPFVYKDNFLKALNFFKSNNLKYTLEFEINRFKPVFIDANFREIEYGKSEKVLITNLKNDEFLIDEINYIIKYTKHANSVIVDKKHQYYLKEKFNFAALIDFEVELNEKSEKGLFDD